MTSNIFIVYAPGLGGNHLANVLSLTDHYTPRCSIQDYDNILDGTTHFGNAKNIEFDKFKSQIDMVKNQNNVFCGHLYQYHSLTNTNLLKNNFPNRIYLVIQFPIPGSIAYTRMLNWNLNWSLGQEINVRTPMITDIALMYDPYIMKIILNENEHSCFYSVDPNLLFNQDINVLFDSLTYQKFNIPIDRNATQNLHSKWLDNLRRTKQI